MRVRDVSGAEGVLVIVASREGTVRASLGTTAIELDAVEVSRLVGMYRQAQAAALQERGRW